ncbi:protein tyrosine phosphatase [Mucilaginibacter pallidiroseus]|uniref:Protein tyrosine phosphatase n=1 Tax=Mucilaginibacter pallidiroseus TaxID=2599295 RepID=A0A563UF07_9SPHI|nr:protein tyrosine phosphatase [Mucilaginibacter pallidiroseus]TWR29951.1 protein tyrosine phosphatase [Mucilaginibacter pallidiroseus]
MPNLLFICSKNQWRSPTAELLVKNHQYHNARSAGTTDKARIKLNQKMIDWADVIFVMEGKHRDIMRQRFRIAEKQIAVLHIEDRYQFNDPELVRILQVSLSDWL